MSVSVIGAGAFGTALAISLAQNAPVCLWSRSEDQVRAMVKHGENTTRLPGIAIPGNVTVTGDMTQATQARVLLLAVPLQQLRGVLTAHRALVSGKTLVACCKGVEA